MFFLVYDSVLLDLLQLLQKVRLNSLTAQGRKKDTPEFHHRFVPLYPPHEYLWRVVHNNKNVFNKKMYCPDLASETLLRRQVGEFLLFH